MYAAEESDFGVVPMNQPNNSGKPSAEAGEGRPEIKENIAQSNTQPTQSGAGMSQGLSGVRKRAKERKQEKFTALMHHLTVDLLRESYFALQRKAAPGVDGETWQQYGTGLEERLADLHNRVHRGAYRAKPSRRVFIPKADGRQRPLGIAALEDKVVQQAVVTVLNQIYEADFKGFSYGFRPGRSPHQALDALYVGLVRSKVNWVLDADIRSFFDRMSHEWTMQFVQHRVADNRILRLIQKWLRAGVLEEGEWKVESLGYPYGMHAKRGSNSTSLRQQFADRLQFPATFTGGPGICQLQLIERIQDNLGNNQPGILLIVGGNGVPRHVMGACSVQAILKSLDVILPVFPLVNVRKAELPILVRLIDAFEESLSLFALRKVEEELEDPRSVTVEMLLHVHDGPIPLLPDGLLVP